MISPAYRLIAMCTRAIGSPSYYAALRRMVEQFDDWASLPELAEKHGMAALLYHHLRGADITIPMETRTVLQGIVLRRQRHARAFMQATADILRAFDAAGVPLLVMKGVALGMLIYPDPMLRPLSDIDLAVAPADLTRTLHLLRELGYEVPESHIDSLIWRSVEGIPVTIDLKVGGESPAQTVFWETASNDFAGFADERQSFTCLGERGLTLGREALLIFLSRHLAKHLLKGSTTNPLRLIWIADLVSYAEQFKSTLDWDKLDRFEPSLRGRLATCAAYSQPDQRLPAGIDRYFHGWPHRSSAELRAEGAFALVRQSCCPSEWWLRLYHGSTRQHPPTITLRMHHLGTLGRFALHRTLVRVPTLRWSRRVGMR